MDRDFKPINELYLNQAFAGDTDLQVLAESQNIAKAHVLAENAIVSMGNNIENCSYCFFDGLADFLRIHDAEGKWHWVEHRMYPMAYFPNGTLWLCMCVYTMSRTEDRTPKIVNIRTGEWHMLTNKDYESLLSQRELEVLRLIHDGLLSKEIAKQLHISLNTVNRHRKNILQQLNVNNAMEACKAAKLMGLIHPS